MIKILIKYVVFGGLKEAILFLRDYKITKEDISYLRLIFFISSN